MITDNHRKIADLAARSLHLGIHRRAKLLNDMARIYPYIVISSIQGKIDGKKLRRVRREKRWSMVKLARKALLSPNQIQNIEKGRGGTTRKRTLLLAQILNVSLDEITST